MTKWTTVEAYSLRYSTVPRTVSLACGICFSCPPILKKKLHISIMKKSTIYEIFAWGRVFLLLLLYFPSLKKDDKILLEICIKEIWYQILPFILPNLISLIQPSDSLSIGGSSSLSFTKILHEQDRKIKLALQSQSHGVRLSHMKARVCRKQMGKPDMAVNPLQSQHLGGWGKTIAKSS